MPLGTDEFILYAKFIFITELHVWRRLMLWHPPPFKHIDDWKCAAQVRIRGVLARAGSIHQGTILLEEERNGNNRWLAALNFDIQTTSGQMQYSDNAKMWGCIFFCAHPILHIFVLQQANYGCEFSRLTSYQATSISLVQRRGKCVNLYIGKVSDCSKLVCGNLRSKRKPCNHIISRDASCVEFILRYCVNFKLVLWGANSTRVNLIYIAVEEMKTQWYVFFIRAQMHRLVGSKLI